MAYPTTGHSSECINKASRSGRASFQSKSNSTRIVEILSTVSAVIGLCLILALTLRTRLLHGRRTFLSDFLVPLSGSTLRSCYKEHAPQNSHYRCSFYIHSKLRQSSHAPISFGAPTKGNTKVLQRKVRLSANSRAGVFKPIEDITYK